MASPAWLPQEVQSSTSQALVSGSTTGGPAGGSVAPTATSPSPIAGTPTSKGPSGTPIDSMEESAQAKFSNAPGYVVPAPSFSYGMLPNASTTSGSSQQSSSSSAINSNLPASTVVRQPLVPGPSSSASPTFSYNITHTSAGLPGSQQFQSKTLFSPRDGVARQPIAPGNSQGGKNAPPTAASLQPPVPGQSALPNSFVPGTALPIMLPPVPSADAASFSFNGNPQFMQKDQSLKSNTSAASCTRCWYCVICIICPSVCFFACSY
ncbi:hypothetical protein L1049_023187 [Liquidambar formosana]|uniref:Uncharacterized protein n=1 Tax=Liquidambar formosana TaxID=63359 RepID=A0AAP0REF4_LIQFO